MGTQPRGTHREHQGDCLDVMKTRHKPGNGWMVEEAGLV